MLRVFVFPHLLLIFPKFHNFNEFLDLVFLERWRCSKTIDHKFVYLIPPNIPLKTVSLGHCYKPRVHEKSSIYQRFHVIKKYKTELMKLFGQLFLKKNLN